MPDALASARLQLLLAQEAAGEMLSGGGGGSATTLGSKMLADLQKESGLMAGLHHPNIVQARAGGGQYLGVEVANQLPAPLLH